MDAEPSLAEARKLGQQDRSLGNLIGAIARGQFEVADRLLGSLGQPGKREEPRGNGGNDDGNNSGALVSILETFGKKAMGWTRGLVEWLDVRFTKEDFNEFGYDDPEMVDQLVDYLAEPGFDPYVAEWFCEKYLEYSLDAISVDNMDRIRRTATPEALRWASFILEDGDNDGAAVRTLE